MKVNIWALPTFPSLTTYSLQLGCRAWNLRIITVVALTLANVLLVVRLLNNTPAIYPCEGEHSEQHQQQQQPQSEERIVPTQSILDCPLEPIIQYNISGQLQKRGPFRNLDLQLGRWDKTRTYKIFENVVVGKDYGRLNKEYTVCVAAQSSLDRMGTLVELAHQWTGPISVAVFAVGDDNLHLLQIYIEYLRKCFSVIESQVVFHLMFPKSYAPTVVKEVDIEIDVPNYDCMHPKKMLAVLERLLGPKTRNWHTKNPYPQNHMRNVARKNCQSDFVFLVDIDIVPSNNMAKQLDKFLRKTACSGKCAYVIPTYEIDNRALFPKTKTDLISLAQRGLARPFHKKVFIYNQYATNFTR